MFKEKRSKSLNWIVSGAEEVVLDAMQTQEYPK